MFIGIQLKSKAASILFSLLVCTAIHTTLLAAPENETAQAGVSNASQPTANPAPGAEARPTAATPTAASPVLLELQRLKETVRAQAAKLAENAQEIESERAQLQKELDRIDALESEVRPATGVAAADASIPEPPSAYSAVSPGAVSVPNGVLAAVSPIETETAKSAPAPVDPQASAASGASQALAQNPPAQGNVDTRLNSLERRVASIGPLTFGGDFRLRDEPFFGGPADRSLDRNRARYRLRFNVDTKLSDGISGGFAMATGDVNDPISTNQTSSLFYSRKPFSLDRAFIQYTPPSFSHLTLVGGKFAYNWYNTELTWDKDINPEGLGQTLAFDLKSTPVLKRVAFVGFELPFAEVAGVALNNKSIVQSVVYGGQWQTTWQLTPWLTFSAYEGFYNFHNADPIALALAKANAKNPQTPLVGLLPLGCSSCTVQNAVVTTTSASIVTVNGAPISTGVSTIANAQFASKFGLFDSIGRFDVKTPWEKWPVQFIGDFVENTKACANVGNIQKAPANTAIAQFTQTANFGCDPHERTGYWGEAEFGRIKERGDWQFGYTRVFIEREAVLSNFDYSELRQGSAVTEHRVTVFYTVNRNVALDFIGLFGRPLNLGSSAPPEDFLKRLQFDVNYTF